MNKNKLLEVGENRSGYFIKRLFTFAFDWYLSSVFLNLLMRLVFIISNNANESGDLLTYNTSVNIISLFLPILVSFIYFVLIPYRSKNAQTLMMKATRIKIVNDNNEKASFKNLMIRFFIGCFLLEGVLFSSFNKFLEALLRILRISDVEKIDYYVGIFMIVLVIISLLMSLRDKKENKTLHDKISSTKVINIK